MKLLLNIFCWIMAAFCIYFPLAYFNSDMDKKEFKVSHIQVESEQKASEIKKEILDKKLTFDKAVNKYSVNPSKDNKGDLGYSPRGVLVPEFEQEIVKMKKFEVSEPIKTEDAWHLVKLTDIKYYSDKENFAKRY